MCGCSVDIHLFDSLFTGRYTGYFFGKLSLCGIVKLLIINCGLHKMLEVLDLLIPTTKRGKLEMIYLFFLISFIRTLYI